jgi:L-cysteine desulfidase
MTVADYTSAYADYLRMMVYLTLVTELSIANGVADDVLRRTFAAADARWSAAMAPAIATAIRTTTIGGGA